MNQRLSNLTRSESPDEPTWDIATLFPNQGSWSEEEYLALDTNHLVEFSHGYLEILEMPTTSHQDIVLFLWQALMAFVGTSKLGKASVAPLRIRLWPGKYREPDVVFLRAEHRSRIGEQFWEGADLVMEVISDDRQLDYETKRAEYAQAGIPEYWIVDPLEKKITMLALDGGQYAVHGEFREGEQAKSLLLAGLTVEVEPAFVQS
ncbi:MAG: Uma2 family endonuclease [Gemmataceae bacterium]